MDSYDNSLPASVAEEEERTGGSAVTVAPKRNDVQLVAQESVLAIMPTNIDEAGRYATGLCRAGIVPDAFRKDGKKDNAPDQPLVLMGVLKAMELHVAPQTGLAGLLPLNGRFSVWGDLAAALVQRTGQVERQTVAELGEPLDESLAVGQWPDDYGFKVCYWRKGQADPYIGEFTVREAKRAGLWNNARRQPWILYPKRMLFNRARAFALRDGFADGLAGLTIAEEVMDHLPPPVDERGTSKRLSSLIDEEEQDAAVEPVEGAESGK